MANAARWNAAESTPRLHRLYQQQETAPTGAARLDECARDGGVGAARGWED
ncbi:MAG: hypothetical protein WBX11_01845 [Thiobacillaceae bacterium]